MALLEVQFRQFLTAGWSFSAPVVVSIFQFRSERLVGDSRKSISEFFLLSEKKQFPRLLSNDTHSNGLAVPCAASIPLQYAI